MRPEPEDQRLLWHMMEYGTHALYSITGLDADAYTEAVQPRLAAERSLDILGRAASRVSATFQSANPEIPWRRIAEMARMLDYPDGEPDDEQVWAFLRQELPGMMEHIDALLSRPDAVEA